LWYNTADRSVLKEGDAVRLRRLVVLVTLVVLVLFEAACQGETRPTPTPELAPVEIAQRAADVMLSVDALHFKIERDGALAYIDTQRLLAFKRAEGDFKLPNQLRALVRVITAFTPIDIGMIVVGEDQYATDPVTGAWDILPPEWGQFSLLVLFDPETGLQRLLKDGVFELKLAGQDKIEGQDHYHLTGRASGERLSAMTLGFIGNGDVELEVWIGTEDLHVRRIRIVEPETDPDDPRTWDLSFSNLGEPVEIQAPPISLQEPGLPHLYNGIAQMAGTRQP
jgi:lipoprotein LprG